MPDETIPERVIGRAYVTPDLGDLNACKTFVHSITAETGLRVEFTVDVDTGTARILIGSGSSFNKLRVPPGGVIVIIGTVVYALDTLHVDEGADVETRVWGVGA